MTRKHTALYVAIIKHHRKGKLYTTTLLRRSCRDGKKVKHETLGNISHLPAHIIQMIAAAQGAQLPGEMRCASQKKNKPQIVIGLLCNSDGCPVAAEVFDGNQSDPLTLAPQIQKLREQFGLRRVVVVGDRGVLTQARIDGELREAEGLDWLTALRAPAIQELARHGTIQR